MNIVAIALFVGLLAFGRQIFGWHDESGKVQMVLIAAFILGYFAGHKRVR